MTNNAPEAAPSAFRLTLIGLLFVSVVIAVVSYTHQLIVPIFLGLLTWGKAWIKALTPKLGLLLLKNGVVIQLRQLVIQASTHVLLKSHRPWRRWLSNIRQTVTNGVKRWLARYLQLPLWLRTVLALMLLVATAGSSFALFALLIIPQPVLIWCRRKITALLNKLGVTRFFAAMWTFVTPKKLRKRWHMYIKWQIGRRQLLAARQLHEKVRQQTRR